MIYVKDDKMDPLVTHHLLYPDHKILYSENVLNEYYGHLVEDTGGAWYFSVTPPTNDVHVENVSFYCLNCFTTITTDIEVEF